MRFRGRGATAIRRIRYLYRFSDDGRSPGNRRHGHGHDGHGHDGHEHESHGPHRHGLGGRVRGLLRVVLHQHAHDPATKLGSELAASAEGMRAVRLSLMGLGVTGAIQFAVVLASGSVALLADTIHNAADALTAVPFGIAFLAARRRPNRRYNYGYGRSEDIAGLFVLLVMCASSLLAAYEAVDRLIHPGNVSGLGWVAAAGVVGVIGNELVAGYRIRVGRRIGSAALVADGLHARTDGLTSLAVVLGAVGVSLGWRAADPVAGLVISIAIFAVLRHAASEVYGRIMDRIDDHSYLAAEKAVRQTMGIASLDRLRMRWVGHDLLAEVDVGVDAALSLVEAHDIAKAVRRQMLHRVTCLTDVTVHVSPVPRLDAAPRTATRLGFEPITAEGWQPR